MNVDFKLQKSGLADPENGISGDVTEAPSRKKMKVDGTSMGDGSRLVRHSNLSDLFQVFLGFLHQIMDFYLNLKCRCAIEVL